MKIDVSQIIADYVRTIRGEKWTIPSSLDAIIIFFLPIGAAVSTYWFKDSIGYDFYLSLFTLFGVFVAVFIAVQGVLVSLHAAPPSQASDSKLSQPEIQQIEDRNSLVKEVSFSLSYLKLIMILGMALMVLAIATRSDLFLFKWISIALSAHLFLNLLVVLKRLHSLFHFQFSDDD